MTRPTDMLADTYDDAELLDAKDPLRKFRDEFHVPMDAANKPLIYFCGHSLGLQPRAVGALLQQELDEWRRLGVEAHFAGRRPWLSYHERLASGLARLTGAMPQEVVAMNSLSVNLHLLLTSFYRPTRERHKILIERSAFPSDRYAVESQIKLHGYDPTDALLEIAARDNERFVRRDDVLQLLQQQGSQIATILLPGVQYLTGQLFDIAAIAQEAQRQGCKVGFDLAHAIGNVPLALHDANVDFAVWCSYKYLNAGPGAIGGAFVHERHANAFDLPRLAGWWGHDKHSRFAMPETFSPLAGAEGWQVSNPPILAMAPLLASLEIFSRVGMERLRDKSMRLTGYLEQLLRQHLSGRIEIITTDRDARGAQLSLRLSSAKGLSQKIHAELSTAGIVCDWREPDIIRVAPVPLYNTYREARTFVRTFAEILA